MGADTLVEEVKNDIFDKKCLKKKSKSKSKSKSSDKKKIKKIIKKTLKKTVDSENCVEKKKPKQKTKSQIVCDELNTTYEIEIANVLKEFNVDTIQPVVIKDQYLKPPHLILAYTYFLNDDFNRIISIGFSTSTLKPVVVLHHVGNGSVVLTPNEWYSLFLHQQDIEGAMNGVAIKNPIFLSDDTKISQDDSGRITIKKTSFSTTFTFQLNGYDWQCFIHLSELFKSILHLYTRSQEKVNLYYVKYTQLCFEKNVMCLDVASYFVVDNAFNLNLPRLFNELGLLFKQKCLNGLKTL